MKEALPIAKSLVRRAEGFIKLGKAKPLWFETVAHRHPPLIFKTPSQSLKHIKLKTTSKKSPAEIVFTEDHFVAKFFKQNPTEKFTITSIDESGNQKNAYDEDGLLPCDRLIQRQMELMERGKNAQEAYQVASDWFWKERNRQKIERKVAREEYLHNKGRIEATTSSLSTRSMNLATSKKSESINQVIKGILEEEKEALTKPEKRIKKI